MKLKLFEYVMLLHPLTNKEGKADNKTTILKDVTRVLAADEKQVGILAARNIPEDQIENLDRVEVIVRPF